MIISRLLLEAPSASSAGPRARFVSAASLSEPRLYEPPPRLSLSRRPTPHPRHDTHTHTRLEHPAAGKDQCEVFLRSTCLRIASAAYFWKPQSDSFFRNIREKSGGGR